MLLIVDMYMPNSCRQCPLKYRCGYKYNEKNRTPRCMSCLIKCDVELIRSDNNSISIDEAIKWLTSLKEKIHGGDEEFDRKRLISLDMGIESLTTINNIKNKIGMQNGV